MPNYRNAKCKNFKVLFYLCGIKHLSQKTDIDIAGEVSLYFRDCRFFMSFKIYIDDIVFRQHRDGAQSGRTNDTLAGRRIVKDPDFAKC